MPGKKFAAIILAILNLMILGCAILPSLPHEPNPYVTENVNIPPEPYISQNEPEPYIQSQCRPDFFDCEANSDCCSNNCINRICFPRECRSDYSRCNENEECCSNNCMAGECRQQCKPDGQYCESGFECCSGLCSYRSCTSGECKTSGGCNNDLECCPDYYCTLYGCKKCKQDTAYCEEANECCSEQCVSNRCTTPGIAPGTGLPSVGPLTECVRQGEFCVNHDQCCSNYCDLNSNICTSGTGTLKIWVGDKNSHDLPGAEVLVDGVSKGITDTNGRVYTEATFGKEYIVSARLSCGDDLVIDVDKILFDEINQAVYLYIDACTAESTGCLPDGSVCDSNDACCSSWCDLPSWTCARMPTDDGTVSDESCSGVISGYVYDAATGKPIENGALTSIYNLCGSSPVTNPEGYYTFSKGVCPEGYQLPCPLTSYDILCYSEGYEPIKRTITTDANGNAEVNFELNKYPQPAFGNR